MKELFRENNFTRVAFYQSMLEAEGIPTFIRNEALSTCEAPIPEFFPTLCAVNETDHGRATEIIRKNLSDIPEGMDREIGCPSCGEPNPGNFELCWSCQKPLQAAN